MNYTDPMFDPAPPVSVPVTPNPAAPVHPETARVSTEDLARETAEISPEGRPTTPRLGLRSTFAMTMFVVIAMLAIAGIVAYFVSPGLGLAILVIGGLCVTVFNPVVWAAAFRAGDNERGAVRATRDPRVRSTPRAYARPVSSRQTR